MTRHTTRLASHYFDNFDELSFSAEEYSLLKFGADSIAKKFGYELADKFFAMHGDELVTSHCVVIPSPYNYVQNAASVLARHFTDRLNHLMIHVNGNPAEWSIIHRKVSYTADYGFLPKEKRRSLIDNDEFYFNAEFVDHKTLIFIDDVYITGTHEEKLVEILDQKQMNNRTFFLYYGQYLNGDVGANIEAKLNFAGIKDVYEFVQLVEQNESDFNVIVRPIKFLLSSKTEDFVNALKVLPENFIKKIYNGCIGEGYHKIPSYQHNFQIIHEMIS